MIIHLERKQSEYFTREAQPNGCQIALHYLSLTITTNLLGKVNAGGWLIVFISKLVLLSIGCWIWNEINIRVHKRVF